MSSSGSGQISTSNSGLRPEGAREFSPGFTLGVGVVLRFALKGHEFASAVESNLLPGGKSDKSINPKRSEVFMEILPDARVSEVRCPVLCRKDKMKNNSREGLRHIK
jgi:hypothetical protein